MQKQSQFQVVGTVCSGCSQGLNEPRGGALGQPHLQRLRREKPKLTTSLQSGEGGETLGDTCFVGSVS